MSNCPNEKGIMQSQFKATTHYKSDAMQRIYSVTLNRGRFQKHLGLNWKAKSIRKSV